ncbi:hypothetical protein ACFWII_22235 [Streptomyces sp. NPDC127063]|uniref:hypothetical protein n=1 Tax=unclassified Streptomyces TaxID=2593676 RepID=UPI003665E936
MVKRQRQKKKRPSFGLPKAIVLLATPDGWRHSVLTVEGGMLCGRLSDVPADADPAEARTAAATMVMWLARHFHETEVEVTWDPPREPCSWTGQVTPATDNSTTAPNV